MSTANVEVSIRQVDESVETKFRLRDTYIIVGIPAADDSNDLQVAKDMETLVRNAPSLIDQASDYIEQNMTEGTDR